MQVLSHEVRRTLWQATEWLAKQMNPQDVSNTLWALAVLDVVPPAGLTQAAERVAPDMNTQDIANTLWALATWYRKPA
jgi:hypothetical protein